MRSDRSYNRRRFLRDAGTALAAAQSIVNLEGAVFSEHNGETSAGEAQPETMLVENKKGGFRFMRGIAPYSSGAVAMEGYEVAHATFSPAPPYRKGFEEIDRHLRKLGRPPEALCGIELRSPRPFTFAGFNEFNQRYLELLEKRGILAGGLNPVARTNVAPEIDPP